MENSFLFIVPLTPRRFLTEGRRSLQAFCLNNLLNQSYPNWKAILIGEIETKIVSPHFIYINFEGHKEEKLQVATAYIGSEKLEATHLIRLDDDDIFNPTLLEKIRQLDFDLFVDKFQHFWNPDRGLVANKIFYWFPNTCIHKSTHALSQFGTFPSGSYKRFRTVPLLIENEHNDFHFYYARKNIVYAKKNDPVYLRALNRDSITSMEGLDFNNYLNEHGFWHKNRLPSFLFLNKPCLGKSSTFKQSLYSRVKHALVDFRVLKNYNKVINGR